MGTIQEIIETSRIAAEAGAFPPFVGAERDSTPLNASPYVAHLDDLREGTFLSNREALMRKFVAAVDGLPASGVRAVAALLGGSAIGPKPNPGDLDCVIFYESSITSPPDASILRDLTKSLREHQLDVRLIPMDGDPIIMMKAVSFFSMLYSKNEGNMTIVRGLVLIDCRAGETNAALFKM